MRNLDRHDPRFQRPQTPQRRPLSNRLVLAGLRGCALYWEYAVIFALTVTLAQAVVPNPLWWVWLLGAAAAALTWYLRPRWRGGYRNVKRNPPMYDESISPTVGNKLAAHPELAALYYQLAQPSNGWVDACKFAGEPLATRDQYKLQAAQNRRMALAGIPGHSGVWGKALQAARLASTAHMALVEAGHQIVPIKALRLRATGVAVGVDAGLVDRSMAEKVAPLLAQFFRVPNGCRIRYNADDAYDRTVWFEFLQLNPLKDTKSPATPPTPQQDGYLPFAVAETGEYLDLRVKEVSGMVIGGQAGSGKTAGVNAAMGAAIQLPNHQFVVADGKGGTDWEWIKPRAMYYGSDPQLEELEAVLTKVENIRLHRMATLRTATGSSNLWHHGPTVEYPVIWVLLDECQTWFEVDKTWSKDEKEAAGRILSLVRNLIKKGRSAGICCVLMTQKPTADSIPTSLRSVCPVRLAFGLKEQPDVTATLGGLQEDEPVNPLDFVLPGTVALQQEGQRYLTLARTYYYPEEALAQLATATAGLNSPALLDVRPASEEVPQPQA